MFIICLQPVYLFFFFNDTATTEIYTLSLHDALPIFQPTSKLNRVLPPGSLESQRQDACSRSEEHTSELQSPCNLVCRLLLEKKKTDLQTVFATTSEAVCILRYVEL